MNLDLYLKYFKKPILIIYSICLVGCSNVIDNLDMLGARTNLESWRVRFMLGQINPSLMSQYNAQRAIPNMFSKILGTTTSTSKEYIAPLEQVTTTSSGKNATFRR